MVTDSGQHECTNSNETGIESITREIFEDSIIYMCCMKKPYGKGGERTGKQKVVTGHKKTLQDCDIRYRKAIYPAGHKKMY